MPPGEFGKLPPGLFGKLPKGVCGGDGGGDGFTASAALTRFGIAGVLPRAAAAASCRTRGVLAKGDRGSGALLIAAFSATSARDTCAKGCTPVLTPPPLFGGGGGSAISGVGSRRMLA